MEYELKHYDGGILCRWSKEDERFYFDHNAITEGEALDIAQFIIQISDKLEGIEK